MITGVAGSGDTRLAVADAAVFQQFGAVTEAHLSALKATLVVRFQRILLVILGDVPFILALMFGQMWRRGR